VRRILKDLIFGLADLFIRLDSWVIVCRDARRRRCSPQCAPLPRGADRLSDRQQRDVAGRGRLGEVPDREQRPRGARLRVRVRTLPRRAPGRTARRSGGSSTLAGRDQPGLGRLDPDPPDGPVKRPGLGHLRGDGALWLRDHPGRPGRGRAVRRDAPATAASAHERPPAGHPGDRSPGRSPPGRRPVCAHRRRRRRGVGRGHVSGRSSRGLEAPAPAPSAAPGARAVGERAGRWGQAHSGHLGIVECGSGDDGGDGHLRTWGGGAVRTPRCCPQATCVSRSAHRPARCRLDPCRRVEPATDRQLRGSAGGGHRPRQFRGRRAAASHGLASERSPRLARARFRAALCFPGRSVSRPTRDADWATGAGIRGDLAGAVRTPGADASGRFARDRARELPHDLFRFGRGRGPDRGLARARRPSAGRFPARTASRCRWSARSRRSTGSARTRRCRRAPSPRTESACP
jgi:hypothetical protein